MTSIAHKAVTGTIGHMPHVAPGQQASMCSFRHRLTVCDCAQDMPSLRRRSAEILRPYALRDHMRLYIKARVVTAGGTGLVGYVMNADAFVVTFVAVGRKYTFSRHSAVSESNGQSLRGLKAAIGRSDPVFPLQYETNLLGPDGAPIAGKFTTVTDAE
jgi:hypothetical protein